MPSPHHSIFTGGCSSRRPTNSVNALKALIYVINMRQTQNIVSGKVKGHTASCTDLTRTVCTSNRTTCSPLITRLRRLGISGAGSASRRLQVRVPGAYHALPRQKPAPCNALLTATRRQPPLQAPQNSASGRITC